MNDSSNLGDAVWNRRGTNTMSRRLFTLCMGFFVLLGLSSTAIVAYNTLDWGEVIPIESVPEHERAQYANEDGDIPSSIYQYVGPINIILLNILVLIVGIVGIFISLKSDNPLISLFGYALVAIPFGLILGSYAGAYTGESVVKVAVVTAMITGIMSLIGALIPRSLESWGGWLLGLLVFLILGQFGIPLAGWLIPGFPIQEALTIWDWFGVLLFSAYIIFDMNRAMRVPATLDNAVDCALALYLDIINLFIRLLSIMEKRK